jgi:dienelactone hydrolase
MMTKVMTKVYEPPRLEPAASARVRRTPLYFESQKAWLFGWVHQGEASSLCERGVIISAPPSHEQIHAHRSLRHLADALAEAGFPVMRFDYHGTGDSTGVDEDADRHATWLANLRSAIDWMRGELGCAEISVVGIRLGAALAAQVAVDDPLADLVLWAPVVKGRAYVREMKAVSAIEQDPAGPRDMIVPEGIVLTQQTAQELSAIDLLGIQPRCGRALIVDRDDMPSGAKLVDHLRHLGIETRHIAPPGYTAMMVEPYRNQVPHEAIADIVAWMRGGLVGQIGQGRNEDPAWPTEAVLVSEPGNALREQAVCVCREPDLFGIFCELATPPSEGLDSSPAIILLNGGSHYHTGPARCHVALSRSLARRGFRCLRMDFHGQGDSVTSDLARENELYPSTAFRDIDLAMKFLQREFGVRHIVLMGHCAGAYFAFQSAAQLTDPALAESILINPKTFYWQEGMTLDRPESEVFLAFQQIMLSVRKPSKWLNLLIGRSKIGIRGHIRHMIELRKLRRRGRFCGKHAASVRSPSHPQKDDLPGDLRRIVEKGRLLTLFQARTDPGYDILRCFAKSQIKKMCQAAQMKIFFFEKADHNFHWLGPRDELHQALVAHLSDRYLSVGTSWESHVGTDLASATRRPSTDLNGPGLKADESTSMGPSRRMGPSPLTVQLVAQHRVPGACIQSYAARPTMTL